ncbi:HupE/UreJ family protein [Steroidobacter sp.]|uniref:HupE/UreJ family protein n=1 Tax=Steroidobacter sp. TaxID=1978227 RepID=UPI001A5B91EF|nr:HupE/UreJ family protein [Steroidobacter sp.]MBL8268556.1 HupE/UreJ family protein [Steroidobacter sp.]
MSRYLQSLLGALLLLMSSVVLAHKQSDAYLSLDVLDGGRAIDGEWNIALRDLDFAVGVDTDANGEITWGELKARRTAIEGYALPALELKPADSNENCSIRPLELLTEQRIDGSYAVLRFRATCPVAASALQIRYSLLFDLDPNHKGLLTLRTPGAEQLHILTLELPAYQADLAHSGTKDTFLAFVRQGVIHIWSGYDHLLFLLTLLLPAVLRRDSNRWVARESLRDSLSGIAKIVTAFTVSHSITLIAASLGVIELPTRWVESAIALTVLLGALNILFPVVHARMWVVALIFGLIHGFGFASVLGELGLNRTNLSIGLVGFNVGVELGQLVVVGAFVPLSFLFRATRFYRSSLMPAGAVVIAILSTYWLASRALDTSLT